MTKQLTVMYENIPLNKRPDYLEHVKQVEICADYLVGQLGFTQTENDWYSYEFNTVFIKGNIKVKIQFAISLPTTITLVNTDLPYDEGKGLTNVEYFEHFNADTFAEVINQIKAKEKRP